MNRLFAKFAIHHEKEETKVITDQIEKGVVFRGTNLWVLIFAIFIASLGLNVNSPAVIIGAMLISPLMGPIMGLGLSVGINDVSLLRKSFYNFLVATGVALTTSTIFFLISPLNEAHSEILARTSPNIYDVLIALFGGLAGIIATSSKQKGNVIPGVAIATALMPPLCTAGYGLATLKLDFFIGAFYLFIINTVFIALATFVTARFLKFPYKHLPDKKADLKAQRIIWMVVIVTIIPSLYFGYDLVQQDRFTKKANKFIAAEGNFTNDYILNKKIDPKLKVITLVYGGDVISEDNIRILEKKLVNFDLAGTKLEIHQGFSYLASVNRPDEDNGQSEQLNALIKARESELLSLRTQLDSTEYFGKMAPQLYKELKTQYADLAEATIAMGNSIRHDSVLPKVPIVVLNFSKPKSVSVKAKMESWLKVRLNRKDIKTVFK